MTEIQSIIINKPRKAFIAFLLSLFTPGLGQIYNGQLKKGIYLFLLLLAFPFIFGLFRITTTFTGYALLVLLEFSLRIYTIIDAIINARRLKQFTPLKYNKWYIMLLIAFLQTTIFYLYDTEKRIGVRTFKMTTTSNVPKVNPGDCIVADLRAYNNKKISYGDFVVFYSPNGEIWTFRAVGLPLDKIEVRNNELIINEKKCPTTFLKDTLVDNVLHSKYTEVLPNGFKHFFIKNKLFSDTTISNTSQIVVPEYSCFLIGDNRDNAADSRYIGAVNEQDIIGQLMFIYWNKDIKRISLDYRLSE